MSSEVVGEDTVLFATEINEQAFAEDQRTLAILRQTGEQLPALCDVRKVEWDALQMTDRLGSRFVENAFLVGEKFGKIDLHPAQRRRQLHPVRTRVETTREIHDEVDTRVDF